MTLFRKAISGLYDGVSQQSATMRSSLQCEEQVNGWATIADGLMKRPPSEHIAMVDPNGFGSATIHHINRDTSERYIVVVTDGDLTVYDHTTGQPVPVNFPYGKSYLDCQNAVEDYALATVADYTFVVNRRAVCAMEVPETVINYDQLRWINKTHTISWWPGSVYQYPYFAGSTSYMGEKQRFEDLPDNATTGQVYKITGSGANNFASYYVRRNGGVWEEHRDPYLTQNKINPLTMPHCLVREANGTFTFAPFSWAERKVGDAKTNPVPTFIGRPIRDVFFVQNRLGFLVDENIVMSCATDYGNFWRNTVTSYVASDPVDVAVTGSAVAVLYHAVPFNDSVLLFSDQHQFVLSWGPEGLTPDSVSLTPLTAYRTNVVARPMQVGRDIYFCANSSGFSRVYEYYNRPGDDGVGTLAADITAHVPRYIPKDVIKLAADSTNEALFAITAAASNRVYSYKFAWKDGTEKAQSCWSYWEFDAAATILSIEVLDSYVYLLIARPDGVYLERINLQPGVSAPGLDHQVYLDRRVVLNGTYDPVSNKTTFQLPYGFDPTHVRLVRGGGLLAAGALLDPSQYTFPNAAAVAVPGNASAQPCVAGLRYQFRYTFSPQFATTDSGAILSGRTILRSMTVYFTDTAYFATEVAPYGTDPQTETVVPAKLAEFTGKTLGSASLILGRPVHKTGEYSFQVYGEADTARVTLKNDTHAASTFQSAEIEITYHNRAR